MHQDATGSTSRRTFVKCGLFSTGVFVGSATAAAGGSSSGRDDEPAAEPIDRGVMRPYQWTPDQRVTVDGAVAYRPARLEGPHRTYAVSYDRAPSYQALLFVPEPDGDGDVDPGGTDRSRAGLEAGDSLWIGQARGSPSEASTGYVTVDLEPR